MKGLIMMLRQVLPGFGINIKPEEIEDAFNKSKDALPVLAQTFDNMDKRQARLETKMDLIIARLEVMQREPVNRS